MQEFDCSATISEPQQLHCHDRIEIFTLTAGAGELLLGSKRYATAPNLAAFIGPQEVHAGRPLSEPFRVQGVSFSTESVIDLNLAWEDMFTQGPITDLPAIISLLKSSVPSFRKERTKLQADELLVALYESRRDNRQPISRKESKVRLAIDFLRHRFTADLSLSDLAREVNLDPAYLCRAFRKEVGLSPHAYRSRLRVARAVTLLQQGYSPSRAAVETGFCDQSHLTRQMKKQIGTTPGQLIAGQSGTIPR